jgi:hypothetical protein
MVACRSRVGLRRYCTLLGKAGVTLTEDDAWQQYWLFAVYSWVAVTSTAGMASRCQPLHIGLAGTPVATEACENSTVSNSWRNCSPKRSGHNSTG